MAEIYPFPNDQERLWSNAQRKMADKDFLQAQQLYQELYQQTPTFDCCRQLVAATQALGEFKQALAYAEDYLDNYLAEEEYFVEYMHLLIVAGQYLLARAYIQASDFSATTQTSLIDELTQVEQAQQWLQVGYAQERTLKEKQLQRWEQRVQPAGQSEWTQWTQQLTYLDFQQLCQNYLPQATNPFLVPKLIEELVKLGDDQIYQLHNQSIDISQLVLPQQMPFVRVGLRYLTEKTLANPQLEELVRAEWQAHCALMYPFLPQESEASLWIDSYLFEYQALFGDIEPVEQEIPLAIQEKKAKLRHIYQKLL
jgi:hypothetical protein